MSRRFYGSINYSEIVKQAKAANSAFIKTDKGVIYGDITVWLNDVPDQYGNMISIQLNPKKDSGFEPVYIANCREAELKGIGASDAKNDDDVPF